MTRPLYVPIIAKDGFAALICPECHEGYKKLVPRGDDSGNKVAARVFMTLPFWFPGRSADKIEAPTLIIAAENDGLIPVSGVRDTAAKLKKGSTLSSRGRIISRPTPAPSSSRRSRARPPFSSSTCRALTPGGARKHPPSYDGRFTFRRLLLHLDVRS